MRTADKTLDEFALLLKETAKKNNYSCGLISFLVTVLEGNLLLLEYSLRSRIVSFGDFNFPLPHRVISGKQIVRKSAEKILAENDI